MAEKFYIYLNATGEKVEVNKAVYHTYFHMERQERTQDEKKQRNYVSSYDALMENGFQPEAVVSSVEERAIDQELYARLHEVISTLSDSERELIHAIYYEGLTEREYAKQIHLSQPGVNKRRRHILAKLKKLLENYF